MTARAFWGLIVGCAATVAACAPAVPRDDTPAPFEIALPTAVPFASPAASPSPIAPLLADTKGFPDRTDLLDAVCYEYLAALAGESWVWTSQQDLDDFAERVDESEVCPAPAPRLTFDFARGALAGAVSVASGCDAASRVVELARDDAARTLTLRLAWDTRPGCDFELLEPILVEVPPPPAGYTLRVQVGGAG